MILTFSNSLVRKPICAYIQNRKHCSGQPYIFFFPLSFFSWKAMNILKFNSRPIWISYNRKYKAASSQIKIFFADNFWRVWNSVCVVRDILYDIWLLIATNPAINIITKLYQKKTAHIRRPKLLTLLYHNKSLIVFPRPFSAVHGASHFLYFFPCMTH